MKLMRIRELADALGIPLETVRMWVKKDRSITILRPGGPGGKNRYIQLDKLIGRHGITAIDVYTLGNSRWIKAVTLAKLTRIPRRTIAFWCRDRPGFAKRLGRTYYIDLVQFGKDFEEVEELFQKLRLGELSGSQSEEVGADEYLDDGGESPA